MSARHECEPCGTYARALASGYEGSPDTCEDPECWAYEGEPLAATALLAPYVRESGSKRLDDGRWQHRFSQSFLGQFEKCGESARHYYLDTFPSEDTSDTAPGTAVHGAIEACIQDMIDGAGAWHLTDMIEFAVQGLDELLENPGFRYTKVKTADPLRKQIVAKLTGWYRGVLPMLNPAATELKFKDLVLIDDAERVVSFSGTFDYIDHVLKTCDWKTGSRPYERWEKQRWAIQPTAYTWAANQLWWSYGWPSETEPWTWNADGEREFPFTYFVMLPSGEIQRLKVTRTEADWDWLIKKAANVARLIEAELPEWPINDGGWWCSPKWCPAWDICKGASYKEIEWKQ